MYVPALSAACITMLPSGTLTFLPSSSISTMVGYGAGFVFDVVHELVAEVLDHGPHRHGRGVAERADGAALDVVGHRVQQVDVFHAARAVLDAVDHAPQPAGALAAGRALPAALMLVEVREPQQAAHHAAG